MEVLTRWLQLLRVQQWYKNILIFIPLIFSGNLFDAQKVQLVLVGLFSLCALSSANYIINDLVDRARDRAHPEKKYRPIASGQISTGLAGFFAIALLIISFFIAQQLAPLFFISVGGLFLLTQLYTFWLKEEAFVDVILIAINFVIRAASGAFIIDVPVSSWLIICVFFLALFLVIGKREAELAFLGKKTAAHKESLKYYTPEITRALMTITTAVLIVSYALYSFLSEHHKNLLLSIPFALYLIIRYFYLVSTGSAIARSPERVLADKRMVAGLILWLASVILVIYYGGSNA